MEQMQFSFCCVIFVVWVEESPTLTSFSESPLHLLTMLEAEMLKKVVLHSVATALASSVLPVPVCASQTDMRGTCQEMQDLKFFEVATDLKVISLASITKVYCTEGPTWGAVE